MTTFKLDTGAEVTAITQETYRQLGKPQLTDKQLLGPSRQPLKVEGQFKGKLVHKKATAIQPIYVIKGLKTIGLPAIKALNLIARVETMTAKSTDSPVQEDFPNLFKGLGTLGDPYEIQLLPEAKPFSLFTPRKVPIPLLARVKQELDQMENKKIISKVEEPTSWCSGMVVIPKKTGAVRICVDLRPNTSKVKFTRYPK